jgi:hypothetical protein
LKVIAAQFKEQD